MRKQAPMLLASIAIGLSLSACHNTQRGFNHNNIEVAYDYGHTGSFDFDEVGRHNSVAIPFQDEVVRELHKVQDIKVSSTIALRLKAGETATISGKVSEEVALKYLRVSVQDETLHLSLDIPKDTKLHLTNPIVIELQLPTYEYIKASGASLVVVDGTFPTGEVELEASGASNIHYRQALVSHKVEVDLSGASHISIPQLSSQETEIELSGASTAKLSGTSGTLRAEVSGASQMTCNPLKATKAELELSGASRAEVNSVQSIAYDLSGASSLSIGGNPKILKQSVSGMSKVNKL